MGGWMLSVDFGTTNTAAAACPLGEPTRARAVKLASASTEMPSGVLAHRDGRLLVGEVARNSAAANPPDAYEPTPKRRLGEGAVLLGGRKVAEVDLVAAVLEGAGARAARQFGDVPPVQLRLTHPAAWAGRRTQVLVDAAAAARLPEPLLIPEPVAAATYYARHHPGRVAGGAPVAVFDIGGGTLDVAVLEAASDSEFILRAVNGVDPLGGELFDLRLLDLVREALQARGRDGLWNRFEGPDALGRRRTLHDEVRRAKHTMSEEPTADVAVVAGDDSDVVTITRAAFNERITDDLTASLIVTQAALDAAGVTSARLAQLYLVGGSSFVPLVSELLAGRLGISPATFDDPKTVTALGALTVANPARHPVAPPQSRLQSAPHQSSHAAPAPSPPEQSAQRPQPPTRSASHQPAPEALAPQPSAPQPSPDDSQLSAAARQLLDRRPALRDWVLEHPKALEALQDDRNVFALAVMPDLLDRAIEQPSTISRLPQRRNFDPPPFPGTASQSVAPVAAALFGPSAAASLDALGHDVAAALRTPLGAWRLITASQASLDAVSEDPAWVRPLLFDEAIPPMPAWMSRFIAPEPAPAPRPRTQDPSQGPSPAKVVGAVAAALVGLSMVIPAAIIGIDLVASPADESSFVRMLIAFVVGSLGVGALRLAWDLVRGD